MKKFKRIGAIVVIILLLSMYLVCLIAAIIGSEKLQPLFRAALGMTIAVPIVLYIFLLFLRMSEKRRLEAEAGQPLPPPEEDAANGESPESL